MAFLDLYGFLHESVVCWEESGLIIVSAMQQKGQAEVMIMIKPVESNQSFENTRQRVELL